MQPTKTQTNFDLRSHLLAVYEERCRRNPSYSLRSFARSLGLDQSLLSKILKGQRAITEKTALKIGSILNFETKDLVRLQHPVENNIKHYRDLQELEFEIISDWYHFALLEVFKLKDFKSNPRWMAKRLGLSVTVVRVALERLSKLGLIKEVKPGQWRLLSHNNSWSNTPHTTIARRKLQKQYLAKAIEAVDQIPFEKRENSSITLALDPKLLPELQQKIQEFKKNVIGRLAERGGQQKEVYQLAIALYPLTKLEEET